MPQTLPGSCKNKRPNGEQTKTPKGTALREGGVGLSQHNKIRFFKKETYIHTQTTNPVMGVCLSVTTHVGIGWGAASYRFFCNLRWPRHQKLWELALLHEACDGWESLEVKSLSIGWGKEGEERDLSRPPSPHPKPDSQILLTGFAANIPKEDASRSIEGLNILSMRSTLSNCYYLWQFANTPFAQRPAQDRLLQRKQICTRERKYGKSSAEVWVLSWNPRKTGSIHFSPMEITE